MDLHYLYSRLPDLNHVSNLVAAMPPAMIVLIGALLIELVSWIGFTLIAEQLFRLYQAVFCRSAYLLHTQLKSEVFSLRSTLQSISAMDEFAKWARIRRQLDGKLASFEETSTKLRSTRSMFLLKAQLLVRVLFYMLYGGLAFNYRTTPMFYIADDWVGGGILAWILSLPFAPSGAVSVVVWVFACRRTLRNVLELVSGDTLDQVKDIDNEEDEAVLDAKKLT